MKKLLTNNLGLKLLSVVSAFMLWLIVLDQVDPVTYESFSPIQVTMLNENVVTDQGLVYQVQDNSDVISVRLVGFYGHSRYGEEHEIRESGGD